MAIKREDLISSVLNKVRQTFNDNQGWVRQGKFTPKQQVQTFTNKMTDDTGLFRGNKFGVPTFTPFKALGDYSYKGGPTVREAFNKLPEQAQQDWGQAGLVRNNPLLQKFAPKTIEPLATAVELGPAAYMNTWSKGLTTFSRDTTIPEKAWDLLGVYGSLNPAYATKNLASGPLGVGFNAITNKVSGKPALENWKQGWQQGQEFQFHANPINQATGNLVNQISKSVPFLQKFTESSLANNGITSTDKLGTAIGKWLTTSGKKVLKAAVLETAVETPIWASMTKTDQETYVDALEREALQNLTMNVGMAGLSSIVDARTLAPIVKKSIDTAVTNYWKNATSPEGIRKQGGFFAGEAAVGFPEAQGKFSNIADKKVRFEIDDSKAKYNFDSLMDLNDIAKRKGNIVTVKDLIQHDELFKQYPEIKNMKVDISSGEGVASYHPETDSIRFYPNPVMGSPKSIQSTLLHEIQHAIQTKEGFASGGSPADFIVKRTPAEDIELQNLFLKESKNGLTPEEQARKQSLSGGGIDGMLNKYQRLSGEIEARDVQARMNLTPEQRARTMPYSSQGIPQNEWITKFDNEQAQSTLKSASEEGFDTNNLIRLSKEDRNIMGKFVELVQTNRDKGNLGQLGLDADNIARGLGIDTNLGNKAIASKFNRALELADSLNIQPSYSIKSQPNIGEVSTPQNIENTVNNLVPKDTNITLLVRGQLIPYKKIGNDWVEGLSNTKITNKNVINQLETSLLKEETPYQSIKELFDNGEMWDSGNLSKIQKQTLNTLKEKGLVIKEKGIPGINDTFNGVADIWKPVSQISPESKGIIPQTDIVPEMGKVEQPQIELHKVSMPVQQGSVPVGKVKLKTDQTVSKSSSTTSITPKGRLNTNKLNLTDEQKAAIDQVQENVPVTVISNKEVVDASRLTKGRKTVLTDEMQKKILAQQLNSRQEVVSLQKQYDKLKKSGADELELIALKEKIINQSRVSQQERTFAGRLLQSGNIMANDLATPEQKIYALLDNAGIDSKKYIKDAINVDFKNPTEVVNFYRKYVPPKFGELLDEFRYSNMLSSPLTQIVNTASNIIQSLIVKPIEKTITGQLDWVKSKLTGSERQYYASQGIDYAKGVWKSLPDAWTKFKSIASGKEITLKPDMEFIPTATKGPLKWYTTPLRVLEASDQFFRTLVQSGEKKSLARLKLSDSQIAKRAAESADYTLFRQKFDPDGELGQGGLLKVWDKWNTVMSMARRMPGGKWIVPFLQTPTNILKQGFEYSPLGVTTMIGAKRPLEQLSKAIIGTVVFSATYGLADTGQITWSVPTNEKDKELFYAAGMQPYSIKIGDKWVSFSKIGPLAYPMAMAAALKWAERNNPDQNFGEDLMDAMPQMIKFFGDQSYVRTLGETLDSIKGSNSDILNSAISKQFSNFAGQLVPYRSFQGWLTRMIDPTYRKPEGVVENLMAQTPGLSQNVPAYEDMYGNESKRDMPFVNAISPVKISTEKPAEKSMYESQEQYRIGLNQKNEMKKEFEKTGKIKTKGTATGTKTALYFYTDDTGQFKEVNIDKYTSMPEQTAYQKALKEKQKYTLVDDILDNLSGDQQIKALQALGISSEDATYYNTAKQENYLKSIYVEEEIMNMIKGGQNKDQILNSLASMRKAVNEKILLSDGVINDLVDKNIISYADGKALKNIDKNLKPKKLKAKKPKKISLSSKKFTASKKQYNPLKVKSTKTKSRFTPPKYVKADLRTPTKLL